MIKGKLKSRNQDNQANQGSDKGKTMNEAENKKYYEGGGQLVPPLNKK